MYFNRQRMGATQQSTKVNSSLMKNGLSANTGATPIMLSVNSRRALANVGSRLLPDMSRSTFLVQSFSILCMSERLWARATG